MKLRCLFLAPVLLSCAHAQTAPQYAWVQMVSGGAEVRAIVGRGEACPVAKANGRKLLMVKRAEPADPKQDFPDTCQAALPAKLKHLSVDGQAMPVPNPAAKRILIIGDTGCRVTQGEKQNCTTDWPFGNIAALAAVTKPELVIHVGDYYYREACPAGQTHCENWQNWKLDFFDPARPLFRASPWILARGNHETCARASQGWFRYLDEASAPLPCPKAKEKTFLVPLKGLTLAVIDTADLPDAWMADKKLDSFARDIASAQPAPGVPQWIVTHKPPFVQGYMNPNFDGKAPEHDPSLPDLQLILAGHLHLFGSFNFGPTRPGQLIVGDSGTRLMVTATKLDAESTRSDPNAMLQKRDKIDGQEADFTVKGRFGYFLLERLSTRSTAWKGTLYGADNNPMATCTGAGRELHCAPVTAQ